MNITRQNILLNLNVSTRDETLKLIASHAVKIGIANNDSALFEEFIEREEEASTGFTNGIAIPHAKCSAIIQPAIIYARLNSGIDWPALDDCLVTDAFALMVPVENAGDVHLKMLSALATELMEIDFIETLRALNEEAKIAEFITLRVTLPKK